jgi:hypothetical protein
MFNRLSGTDVLLLLRDKRANDWASLCRALSIDPDSSPTITGQILHVLDQLRTAGLIVFNVSNVPFDPPDGPIQVSSAWDQIQNALGISLTEVSKLDADRSVIANPLFGMPDRSKTPFDVFVLMPFSEEMEPIYKDHIEKVAAEMGLSVGRGDDFFTSDSIMSDVWAGIYHSQVIIAECTGRNPNVFYEIGVAHTIGKRVILLTQNKDDVPFDIRHIRFIEYSYTPPGMREFELLLTKTLQNAKQ